MAPSSRSRATQQGVGTGFPRRHPGCFSSFAPGSIGVDGDTKAWGYTTHPGVEKGGQELAGCRVAVVLAPRR